MKRHAEKENRGRLASCGPAGGFSLVEVIIATVILTIVVAGTFSVYSHAVRVNRGNNLRAQALTVLQTQVEYYRSLKFLPAGSSTELNGGTYTNLKVRQSADGRLFVISVVIDNDPATAGIQTGSESTCTFKEIRIIAVPQVAETGWLANLQTDVTIQRVRSN